jgi:hypothetical protein
MKHLGRQIASQTLPGNQMNAAWRTGIHILAIKIGKI